MQVSVDQLTSILPIIAMVLVSVVFGWVLARGDDANARKRRSMRIALLQRRDEQRAQAAQQPPPAL